MVGGLGELVENPDPASALGGGAEDGEAEHFAGDRLRAGEGEDNSTRFDFLKRLCIELSVTDESVFDGAAVLGESGRVEDDEVVAVFFHLGEKLEGILVVGVMAGIAGEVKLDVGVGEGCGFGRGVDRVDAQRPSAHGIDRETAGVAEHVEHMSPFCETLEEAAVFALVDEEAGLLAFEPVDVELQAVFQSDVAVEGADEIFVFGIETGFIGESRVAFVIDIANPGLGKTGEGFGDGAPGEVHAGGMRLHHGRVAVDVDHEAGKEVPLAMDEPETVVVVADQSQSLAQAECAPQPLEIKIVGQPVGAELEDPDRDASDLVMACAEHIAAEIGDSDEVALFRLAVDGGNRPREHPGMAAQKRFLFSFLEADDGGFHICLD